MKTKGTKICKICGAEYPYCQTYRLDNAFRWQDVACCPEHGAEYLDLIMKSRETSTNPVNEECDQGSNVTVEEPAITEAASKKTRKKRVKVDE